MEDFVVLVDKNDNDLGKMEKMQAHREGVLHRAFSVFVFNSEGKILLQKRNGKKYHSGGLWSNTCCSHPRPGELIKDAAHRRLHEEMGMKTDLLHAFSFIYKSELDNSLIEHELDHVFYGYTNTLPVINEEEVEDFKYVDPNKLVIDILNNPDDYTEWLKICLHKLLTHLTKLN